MNNSIGKSGYRNDGTVALLAGQPCSDLLDPRVQTEGREKDFSVRHAEPKHSMVAANVETTTNISPLDE